MAKFQPVFRGDRLGDSDRSYERSLSPQRSPKKFFFLYVSWILQVILNKKFHRTYALESTDQAEILPQRLKNIQPLWQNFSLIRRF